MANENQANDDRLNSSERNTPSDTGQKLTSQPGQTSVNPQYSKQTNQNTSFIRPNPLGDLSSYTYQISLYMLTPECVNQYSETGTLDRNGYFIVAQSGGLNREDPRLITTTDEIGANRPGLDYFIDDLSLTTTMAGKQDGQTATLSSSFTFKIIEPTGFKLLNNLAAAVKKLEQRSPLIQQYAQSKPNLYQQNYMIAIRFYGYNVDGVPIETTSVNSNASALGDKFALYERIFPIIVSEVKFKIGSGGATTYSWTANLLPLRAAFQGKINVIANDISFRGRTVGEALGSAANPGKDTLIAAVTTIQEDLVAKKKAKQANEYDIQILSDKIANAELLLTRKVIHESTTNSEARRTSEVNVKISTQSNTVDTRVRAINVKGNSKIIDVIDQLIASSTYVSDALSVVNDSSEEKESEPNMASKYLKWYAIHPVVKILGRDTSLKDWVYKTTYQIKEYSVPYVKSPIVPQKQVYYGPVKKYNYLFTGNNTEIIGFEQEYNNLYYVLSTTTVDDDPSNQANTSGKQTPVMPASASDGSATGTQQRGGGEKNTATKTSVNSRADQATATLKILGDPDLLMDSPGYTLNSATLDSFVSEGLSINPYAGQVFLEIEFRTAEDYDDTTGLVGNAKGKEPVYFYDPADHKRLKTDGIIYQLIDFTSTFTRGKFEQTLNLIVVDPSVLVSPKEAREIASSGRAGGRENQNANSGSSNPNSQPNNQDDGSYDAVENARFARQGTPTTESTDTRTPQINPLYELYPQPSNESSDQPISSPYNSRILLGDNRSPISIPTSTGTTSDDDANSGQSPYSLTGIGARFGLNQRENTPSDEGADPNRIPGNGP